MIIPFKRVWTLIEWMVYRFVCFLSAKPHLPFPCSNSRACTSADSDQFFFRHRSSSWGQEAWPRSRSCHYNRMPREDAILCATVHEYGPNWELASELLYSVTVGGVYRGRYIHPVHCCERFRDLMQRHVLSGTEAVNNDKASNTGSGKVLLRVTEENIRMLLNAVSEQMDHEPLIQYHFFALLSSVWRVSNNAGSSRSSFSKSQNSPCSSGNPFPSNPSSQSVNHEPSQKARFTNSILCSKLVAAALDDNDRARKNEEAAICSNPRETDNRLPENLDVYLEFSPEKYDISLCMPSLVIVLKPDPQAPPAPKTDIELENHLRSSSHDRAENQFRVASRACAEDCLGWG